MKSRGDIKREDRTPREIKPIEDDEMDKLLRWNFEYFVSTEKYDQNLKE